MVVSPQSRAPFLVRLVKAWPLYLALAPTLILIGMFTYYTTVQGSDVLL